MFYEGCFCLVFFEVAYIFSLILSEIFYQYGKRLF